MGGEGWEGNRGAGRGKNCRSHLTLRHNCIISVTGHYNLHGKLGSYVNDIILNVLKQISFPKCHNTTILYSSGTAANANIKYLQTGVPGIVFRAADCVGSYRSRRSTQTRRR